MAERVKGAEGSSKVNLRSLSGLADCSGEPWRVTVGVGSSLAMLVFVSSKLEGT